MHNTFTYRHSDLPAFRPEIKAEIVAVGLHADDLILKSQGNYKELEELAETLSNSLDTCELNLQAIRVIPDNDNSKPAVATMTDLPTSEQRMIFNTALLSEIVLSTLQKLTGVDMDILANKMCEQLTSETKEISDQEITASLTDYLEKHRQSPTQHSFKIEIPNI